MSHILINGISSKTAGGKSILLNFINTLEKRELNHKFTIIVDSSKKYLKIKNKNIKIKSLGFFEYQILLPFTNNYLLPKLIRRLNIDLVFNLSDLPIPTKTKQILLFDWPYAAYPSSKAWQLGGFREKIRRKLKFYLFKKNLSFVDLMIAQSKAIKERLKKKYRFNNIICIGNAVSLENINSNIYFDKKLGGGFKLLCLSYYYPHKNLEIFLELANKILVAKKNWKIIITISPKHGTRAKKFLKDIQRKKLSQVLINIGPVSMNEVPSLYKQCDALLLPTLLESFSGTYVEAMFHKKPIFTSNYDFASDVCKNGAAYFNPNDPKEIFDVLDDVISNKNKLDDLVNNASKNLKKMDSWEDAVDKYLNLFL
tara:strand:+ start:16 stop:1122 length:1107 start_codon:yes stop_codon:yes gene_type:complete